MSLQTDVTALRQALKLFAETFKQAVQYDIDRIKNAFKICSEHLKRNIVRTATGNSFLEVTNRDAVPILMHINAALTRSREENPANYHTTVKLTEKVGYLSSAITGHNVGPVDAIVVYNEAVEVAVAAIRIALDGDSDFIYRHSEKYVSYCKSKGDES